MEQRLADILLQPLDLLADGRLGAMHPLASAGKTTCVDNRDEAAQQLEVQHGSDAI
jgi:hypothetical protein